MDSNVNGFILTVTYTTNRKNLDSHIILKKNSNSLRETNKILVIYYSHASWDGFQNTPKTGFILMPLVEMNTTHEGFILERQNLQQNSKTWSESLLIRSNSAC